MASEIIADNFREKFSDYDAQRDFSNKIIPALCYAPFTTLYFDTSANVRVCCHNAKFNVGNILSQTIDDIWSGARIMALRHDLAAYKFGQGCEFCLHQASDGWFKNLAMSRFDNFEIASAAPEWPQQMEFSISNACNLECIMCAGAWSSTIRHRREKLPKQPHLYSRDFLFSLRKYLPHLKRAKFLGGEPFLVREYYVLWDMMIEENLQIPCHVTTNGSQLTPRVQQVMDALPFSFSISLDGVKKETIERIRVNTKYEELMSNVYHFRKYAEARRSSFSLTFCLMRQNWQEFGDYCAFADDLDCSVWINTVLNPPQFGLYTMDASELRSVVRGMSLQAPKLEKKLGRNRNVWFSEFERLRRRSEAKSGRAV